MKTKAQKRNEAKKTAEALKAKRKMIRDARTNAGSSFSSGVKGKSSVPQSKKKK